MEHSFTGRRPSEKQVKAKLKELMASGWPVVAVTWGENWIEARKDDRGQYYGLGWIKSISGSDIVQSIAGGPRFHY